jgi:multisubunit Na+/H+ antiporter MnhB subunit
MKKQSFFQKRSVVATIGIVALLAGFYFLNFFGAVNIFTGTVTGNFVMDRLYPFSAISIIGILLILCSAILIVYAIVKRG